jgi:phosphohistidine swiveling domain-containing protein
MLWYAARASAPGHWPTPAVHRTAGSREAFLWYFDRILALDVRRDSSDSTLTGIAASPGRHTGTVRIIRCEADFDRLRAGDVLVCPATSSVWSVLFPTVGALVTDFGGMLSHPAIIAREFGVPAVVATRVATAQLQNGQVVTRTERPELWRSLDECAAGRSRANQSEQASAADQSRE